MIRNKIKILSILIITLSIISLNINLYAHSGRTDSSGGHKDNNNKSGLGSYHYHCGGYPAHLHTNGVCPYSYSSSSNQGSTSNSSPSTSTTIPTSNVNTNASVNTNTTVPSIITVDKIQINENIESIEVGESKILTVTVTPSDATDKSITWKSSDESIATVSKKGEIVAKKSGVVNITASSSNGKTSTIKMNIKEEIKTEYNNIIDITENDVTNNNQEDSGLLGGVVSLVLVGGGSYLGYKTYKKSK